MLHAQTSCHLLRMTSGRLCGRMRRLIPEWWPVTSCGLSSAPPCPSTAAGQSPDALMHLSLDTMSMVDDGCLSPANFHQIGKGGVAVAGGHVHSIDVILGFSKDQEPVLSPVAGAPGPQRAGGDDMAEHGKRPEPSPHPTYGGPPHSVRNSDAEQHQYHG